MTGSPSEEDPRDLSRIKSLADELIDLQSRTNYCHKLNWLGTPIFQVPTDIYLMQELIATCRPNVIVETGVAQGGSVLASASFMSLVRRSRKVRDEIASDGYDPDEWMIIGVDLNSVATARTAVDDLHFSSHVVLLQGDSSSPDVAQQVRQLIGTRNRVAVFLDSDHSESHVYSELVNLAPLVSSGQFLLVWDTGIGRLSDETHRQRPRSWNADRHAGTGVAKFLNQEQKIADDFRLDDSILEQHPLSSAERSLFWRL